MRTISVLSALALLIGLVACNKAVEVVYAPESIHGAVFTTTVEEAKVTCSSPAGTVIAFAFVDANTAKSVAPDNTLVDLPYFESWAYKKTGRKSANIELKFTIGGIYHIHHRVMLTFTSKTGGTYEWIGGPPIECDPQDHHTGTFTLTPSG